jgi:U3 small nucleolar RNA-associated protein 4
MFRSCDGNPEPDLVHATGCKQPTYFVGRILCLAWDATGDVIVTGSADAVRIWNVQSGHAIHRMTPGRDERRKETIVWCLAVTKDFTIISGDSR